MSITIKDGNSGVIAEVNADNQLETHAVTRSDAEYHNEVKQRYYTFPFDAIDPTTTDDYFVYIGNTSTNKLIITELSISSTVAGFVAVHSVTGTAGGGGAAITVGNRFLGSTNTPTGTFVTDPDITGLTLVNVLELVYLIADTSLIIPFTGGIILPQGQAISLMWDQASGILSGILKGYEEGQ